MNCWGPNVGTVASTDLKAKALALSLNDTILVLHFSWSTTTLVGGLSSRVYNRLVLKYIVTKRWHCCPPGQILVNFNSDCYFLNTEIVATVEVCLQFVGKTIWAMQRKLSGKKNNKLILSSCLSLPFCSDLTKAVGL